MRIKSILVKAGCGLVFAIGFLGIFLFWLADPLNFRAPKDQKLIKVLQDHREAFEKLRSMAVEDSSSLSYFSESTLRKSKLSETRQKEYERLLSEIRPGLIETVDNDNVVRFIFASGGLLSIGPGWLKGIEFIPGNFEREGIAASNLDKMRTAAPGVYLRAIDSNWFLLYQRDDD